MPPRRITPDQDQIVLNRPEKVLIPLSIFGGAVVFCCTGVILYMNFKADLKELKEGQRNIQGAIWTVDDMRRYTYELHASDIKKPDVDAIARRP